MGVSKDLFAIDEKQINKIMLEIIECSNKIKSIFNNIDDQVEKLKANYSCVSATTLYKQYEKFNDNYSIVVNNILSYNDDLLSLKKKYVANYDSLAIDVKKDALGLETDSPREYVERERR